MGFYSGRGGCGSVMVWCLTRSSLPYIKFEVTILEFAYKSGRQFEENIQHSTMIDSGIVYTLQCYEWISVCSCCGSVQFPSKRLGLQFVLIYFLVLLCLSQALQFQTAFLLIHSIVHAIMDDTFNFLPCITITWSLGSLQSTENEANLLLPLDTKS